MQDIDWLREGSRLQTRNEVRQPSVAAFLERGDGEWSLAAGRLPLGRPKTRRTEGIAEHRRLRCD